MSNNVDTIKAIFVFFIATVVVIGGGLMLFVSRSEGNSDFALLIAGFIGSSLTFVFGQEVQTRTARQTTAALYSPAPAPMPTPIEAAPQTV